MRQELLGVLRAFDRDQDRLRHVATLPRREAAYAEWPDWADTALVSGYRALGVDRPWRHQASAAAAIWHGRHAALATSTGSGKSLAFWLPAITRVRSGSGVRRPTVLYLSPTKALAADQLAGLQRLLDAAAIRDVRCATCDGDTDRDERRWVREHADVVLTNPDFLHFSLLPGHQRWARLLRGLSYVVVDEGHAFRGVFGAHVAAVLRRLRRLADHYGATPTFVVASATTADPAVTTARLIGAAPEEVLAVATDDSPQGERAFLLWQPPLLPGEPALPEVDPGEPGAVPMSTVRRSVTTETADVLAELVAAGARALAFTRSRRGAETVATLTREHLAQAGLHDVVAAYRGGYLPEERRDLEQRIRSGELRALATTNALELGVDISGLDAVLIAGWPGTRVSLWQQAGRAGRAGREGLAVFIAREDPLDTYLVTHPEAALDAALEATVFDPQNPYVLRPHLCAAAAELPLGASDSVLFGSTTSALLTELVADGSLRRRPSGWYWVHAESPVDLTDLRGAGSQVRIVESSTGRLLGTVDGAAAHSAVHADAVYVHQGETFVVDELDLTAGVALVRPEAVDHRTFARWTTTVAITQVRASRPGAVSWCFGDVEVTTQVTDFQRRHLPDLAPMGGDVLDLPPRTLPTTAVWYTVPNAVLGAAGLLEGDVPGALHAAEHAAIGLLPLLATCDRWDLGGVSTALHADTECATVFVYDAYPGGAGFAERGFALGEEWLVATRDAIRACRCSSGCPACVQSPKCGNGNQPLDKNGAADLLTAVLDALVADGSGRRDCR